MTPYSRRSKAAFSFAAIVFAGLVTATGLAGRAAGAQDLASSSGNIGFMKNSPQELRAKFPMCEEFLDVQWLDKKYMVGYATYDAFVRRKPAASTVRKRVQAIVAIPFGVPGRYDYDASQFVRQGKLKDLFALIKSGEPLSAGLVFSAGGGDDRAVLHPGGALSYGETDPLLSDHRKTVCIVYPAGDKAWIIEGKTVERAYPDDQVRRTLETLKEHGIKTPAEFFKQMWVLDINGDGAADFFKPRNLIYSKNGRLQKTTEEFSKGNFRYTASGSEKSCVVDSNKMNFNLTTDGRNYFAAGCNWTELSSLK